jgi:hypothetical protein
VTVTGENMGKTIFSKVLWVGGARASTVGLGVMLAVILVLASATAFPTPAVAVHGPPHPPTANSLTQQVAEDEALSPGGPPYTIKVDTSWQLRNVGPLDCKPGTVRQQLWQYTTGTGGPPYELVWQSTEDRERYSVRQRLQTSNSEPFAKYWYIHNAYCENPRGDNVVGSTIGAPFALHVFEDDPGFHPLAPLVLRYAGDWITRPSHYATGGTTHEARQVGAAATVAYDGIAAAWVTTLDEDHDVQASVMWDTCSGTFGCPATRYTGDEFGDARVVKWSNSWNEISYNSRHWVKVISDESRRVDVDAFVLVVRRPLQ